MRTLFIFILFPVAFFSCDSTDPSDNNTQPVEKYYPLKIGNKWEYSFKSEGETAVLERIIKNNIIHEDGSNIWGYTEAVKATNPNPNEPIAGYNSIKIDGLYYYSSDKDTMFPGTTILCIKNLILKSPVIVGTQWTNIGGGLCSIVSIGDFEVLTKNYSNSVLVVSQQNQSIDSSWYALNIGLIQRVLKTNIGTQYESTTKWQLRSYSLL